MTLQKYLKNKPLYYSEIDYTRMPRAYESIKRYLKLPKIIQIIGTNGKGSTGRFLANMLMKDNFSVGHYTSPHIFRFNERIWLNGKNIDDDILEIAHGELQNILPKEFIETLSYFEYTTFLAILIFCKYCDFVVLEAGLGGEYDATTVFPKILSIITPIGYDHSSFLGHSIEEIATSKINSITSVALLSFQYDEVVCKIAKDIAKEKDSKLFLTKDILTVQDNDEIETYIREKQLPSFQKINLQSAFAAMKILGLSVNLHKIDLLILPGRCQKIAKNITIDVGHNIMAALALRECFKNQKIVLVYNSFKDKEYKQILDILFPIIKRVEVLHVEDQRGIADKEIKDFCKEKNIKVFDFKTINQDEEYLVFGSFLVVEKFMKDNFEK